MSLKYVGKGIYTVPEASRLSKISQGKIRRWINGYETARGKHVPVFKPDYRPIDHRYAVSFLDLVELRFIDEFEKRGVTLPIIRRSWLTAKKISRSAHPFATLKFYTDGKYILAESGADFLELTKNQLEWSKIVDSYLIGGLDFDKGVADESGPEITTLREKFPAIKKPGDTPDPVWLQTLIDEGDWVVITEDVHPKSPHEREL